MQWSHGHEALLAYRMSIVLRQHVLARLASLQLLLLAGCTSGEDHWHAFATGGEYHSAVPSLSVDGRGVFFSSPASGHGDIYYLELSSNTTNRLAGTEVMETSPLPSPDGSLLAFERKAPAESRVVLLDVRSTTERVVSPVGVFDEVSDFSPDGKQLVVLRSEYPGGLGKYLKAVVMGIADNMPAQIPIGDRATFSPDSERLAVVSYNQSEGGEVAIYSRTGERLLRVSSGSYARFVDSDIVAILQEDADAGRSLGLYSWRDGALTQRVRLAAGDSLGGARLGLKRGLLLRTAGESLSLIELDYETGETRQIAKFPQGTSSVRIYEDQAIVRRLTTTTRVGELFRIVYSTEVCEKLLNLDSPEVRPISR